MGGSGVTAAGTGTVITGDVGVSPGTSITGFPAGATVAPPFATHANDTAAIAAQSAVTSLYATLAGARVHASCNGAWWNDGYPRHLFVRKHSQYCGWDEPDTQRGRHLHLSGWQCHHRQRSLERPADERRLRVQRVLAGHQRCDAQRNQLRRQRGRAGWYQPWSERSTHRPSARDLRWPGDHGWGQLDRRLQCATAARVSDDHARSPTLPGGTVGVAYSQTITGSGGTAPYSFGVTAGRCPPA